jgi:predicted TPR repeat methyltransferase
MQTQSPQPQPESASSSKVRGGLVAGFKGFMALGNWIDSAMTKVNNLTETNYELAMDMARSGRISDAIFRFRMTLWLDPNHEPSMYNLACMYQHRGENQKALALLARIIKAHPNHANAIYRVATMDPSLLKPEMRPTTVPPIQVFEYFEATALNYDAERQAQGYRLPALLHQLLYPLLQNEVSRHDMLDIGCATGLCGYTFAETFSNVVGCDISPNMLELAYRRTDRLGVKIYNKLVQQDIRHFLAPADAPNFDVIIAMDVLPYIGDLALLAEQLSRAVRTGGVVALSFDVYPAADGFGVMPATGYFGHTVHYVTQSMNARGFETVRTGEVEASTGRFVQLCFFRKTDAAAS